MPFLLLNWRWLAPLAGMAALAAWLGITKLELADLRATDAKALAVATEAARAKDAENQTIAAQIEVAHAQTAQANADKDDALRAAARDHGLYVRVRSGMSCAAPNPGQPSTGTVEARLSDGDADFFERFARDCANDQSIAQAGHDWAVKVGKP